MTKRYENNFAELLKGKDKDNGAIGIDYIEVKKDVVLPKGTKIYLKSMQDFYQGLVDANKMTVEEAEDKILKRHFVKATLTAVIDA